MGWSFRKSINIGPLRINLSKSGIGLSAGVKGARISVGPKGTQLHMGKDGVYYQKTLSSTHESEHIDDRTIAEARRGYCQQCGKKMDRGDFCQYCGANKHSLQEAPDQEAITAPAPKEGSALKRLFKRFL